MGGVQKALMWPQAPPKLCSTAMSLILLGENTAVVNKTSTIMPRVNEYGLVASALKVQYIYIYFGVLGVACSVMISVSEATSLGEKTCTDQYSTSVIFSTTNN